jgi:hypothetical protein
MVWILVDKQGYLFICMDSIATYAAQATASVAPTTSASTIPRDVLDKIDGAL